VWYGGGVRGVLGCGGLKGVKDSGGGGAVARATRTIWFVLVFVGWYLVLSIWG